MNKIKTTNSSYAILILSCDKYSDLWKPFFSQFHMYWPDCPFPVYLGSNTKKYDDNSVHTILSESSIDWSSDLLAILAKIKQQYLFIWLDDFFPIQKIDTQLFIDGFQFAERNIANHVHMMPVIKSNGVCTDKRFGYYTKGMPYRVVVAGFWNKTHLQRLLLPGENPWKFEIMGSYRSSYTDGYYTLNASLFEFIRVVDKGKISYEAFQYSKRNNIQFNIQHRSVFTQNERIINNIQSFAFQLVLKIPWKWRVYTMEKLRKLLISY